MAANSSIVELNLERDPETPSQLKLGLRLNTDSDKQLDQTLADIAHGRQSERDRPRTRHGQRDVGRHAIGREGVEGMKHAEETGGLSGGPLKEKADRMLGLLRKALPKEVAMIGVGGITRGQDAVDKLKLGADLVQFYTGMVYRGPQLVGECLQAIEAYRKE